MAIYNLTTTEGWSTRINYWDGDVLDHNRASEKIAREAAQQASSEIKADVDICHGAIVVATYRLGREVK